VLPAHPITPADLPPAARRKATPGPQAHAAARPAPQAGGSTRLRVTASCDGCGWRAEGGAADWGRLWRAAEKHCAPGHPVLCRAEPETS
jgi:hypothetical protein